MISRNHVDAIFSHNGGAGKQDGVDFFYTPHSKPANETHNIMFYIVFLNMAHHMLITAQGYITAVVRQPSTQEY